MSDIERRLGGLRALPVTVAFFAIAIIAGLALDDSVSPIVGVALLVALVAYCVARPSRGSDLFWMTAAPNALSMLAHDAFGTPRWLAAFLLPFVLWGAWCIDHEAATDTATDSLAARGS